MYYLFETALHKIFFHSRKYILIVCQLMIGSCMIALSLNISFTFQQQLTELNQSVNNRYINISEDTFISTNSDVLSLLDFIYIRDNIVTGDQTVSYYKEFTLHETHSGIVTILFVDDHFYQNIMKAQNFNKQFVYIGDQAKSCLNNAQTNDFFNKEANTLFDAPISTFHSMNELECQSKSLLSDIYYADFIGERNFDNYIIFSIDMLDERYNDTDISRNTILLSIDDGDDVELQFQNIISYIHKTNQTDLVEINNYYRLIVDELNKNSNIATILNIISVFILCIVFLGYIGLLTIMINRRNKEFAVSLMCGAQRKQILIQIFIEVSIIVLFSVLLGNILSIPLLPIFSITGVNTTYHALTLFISITVGILISFIINIPVQLKVAKITPISLSKNL